MNAPRPDTAAAGRAAETAPLRNDLAALGEVDATNRPTLAGQPRREGRPSLLSAV